MRIDTKRDVVRIPPRHREPIHVDVIHHYWAPHYHYFGHRIHVLPVGYYHVHHWGIDYYCYNNIYYRMYGGYYYVCRPPFGTFLDIVEDIAFSAVRFSYYNNLYRTYNRIDENYATINEQNRIIAENNATIAAQNEQIALNSTRATESYTLANGLGLFQSYANAGQQYYYNDGVFYIMNNNNQYEVIVPPAGALVDELPDDYDTISLNGVEYYLVDTTVYRVTIIDGSAKFEVLGQMSEADAQRYHDQASSSQNTAW